MRYIMNKRIITFIVAIAHLSGALSCALAGAGTLEGFGSAAPVAAFMDVESDTSAIIAVVNKNLCRQVKLVSDLADFTSGLAGKALPGRHKSKPVKSSSPQFFIPAGSFSQLKQMWLHAPAAAPLLSDSPATAAAIITFILFVYLLIRRQKINSHFCRLARGAIESAMHLIQINPLNPHRRNAAEGFLFKTITWIVLTAFVYSFVIHEPLLAITTMTRERNAAEAVKNRLESFMLPYKFGRFMGGSYANNDKLVIFVQDLHCHPEVQRNIYEILKIFDNRFDINRILVEGAPAGRDDTSILGSIPNEKVKKKALTTLLDKGLISGAEYYSVVENKDKLYGLEQWDVYEKNLARVRLLIENKQANVAMADELVSRLGVLKDDYLSSSLKKLQQYLEPADDEKKSDTKRYLGLENLGQNAGEDIADYPNLAQYIRLLKLNNSTKYKRLPAELSEYMVELKKVLPYSVYKTLLDKLSSSDNREDYYLALSEIAGEYTPAFAARYPNAAKFLEYIRLNYTINPINLVSEENAFGERILNRSAATLMDREILFLSRMSRICRNMFDLKVTPEEYGYFKQNVARYRQLLQKYIPLREVKDIIVLMSDKQLYDFFETNLCRNDIFLQNIITARSYTAGAKTPVLSGHRAVLNNIDKFENIQIVVTGGFHTEIVNTLKDEDISYLAVTPNVTEDFNDAIYEKVLTLKITPQDIAASAFAPALIQALIDSGLSRQDAADMVNAEIVPAILTAVDRKEGITLNETFDVLKKWINYLSVTCPEISGQVVFDDQTRTVNTGKTSWKFTDNKGEISLTRTGPAPAAASRQPSDSALTGRKIYSMLDGWALKSGLGDPQTGAGWRFKYKGLSFRQKTVRLALLAIARLVLAPVYETADIMKIVNEFDQSEDMANAAAAFPYFEYETSNPKQPGWYKRKKIEDLSSYMDFRYQHGWFTRNQARAGKSIVIATRFAITFTSFVFNPLLKVGVSARKVQTISFTAGKATAYLTHLAYNIATIFTFGKMKPLTATERKYSIDEIGQAISRDFPVGGRDGETNNYIKGLDKVIENTIPDGGRTLVIGPGTSALYAIFCAMRGPVDIVQPEHNSGNYVDHMIMQGAVFRHNLDLYRKYFQKQFSRDIIANPIDTDSYRGLIQEVGVPDNHYDCAVLEDIVNMNDTDVFPIISALVPALKNNATLIIKNSTSDKFYNWQWEITEEFNRLGFEVEREEIYLSDDVQLPERLELWHLKRIKNNATAKNKSTSFRKLVASALIAINLLGIMAPISRAETGVQETQYSVEAVQRQENNIASVAKQYLKKVLNGEFAVIILNSEDIGQWQPVLQMLKEKGVEINGINESGFAKLMNDAYSKAIGNLEQPGVIQEPEQIAREMFRLLVVDEHASPQKWTQLDEFGQKIEKLASAGEIDMALASFEELAIELSLIGEEAGRRVDKSLDEINKSLINKGYLLRKNPRGIYNERWLILYKIERTQAWSTDRGDSTMHYVEQVTKFGEKISIAPAWSTTSGDYEAITSAFVKDYAGTLEQYAINDETVSSPGIEQQMCKSRNQFLKNAMKVNNLRSLMEEVIATHEAEHRRHNSILKSKEGYKVYELLNEQLAILQSMLSAEPNHVLALVIDSAMGEKPATWNILARLTGIEPEHLKSNFTRNKIVKELEKLANNPEDLRDRAEKAYMEVARKWEHAYGVENGTLTPGKIKLKSDSLSDSAPGSANIKSSYVPAVNKILSFALMFVFSGAFYAHASPSPETFSVVQQSGEILTQLSQMILGMLPQVTLISLAAAVMAKIGSSIILPGRQLTQPVTGIFEVGNIGLIREISEGIFNPAKIIAAVGN